MFHAGGMSARIGDEAHPSVSLLDKHVSALDHKLNKQYQLAQRPEDKRRFALAGHTNLTLWLAWLWSSETFGLEWGDLFVTEPCDGPEQDLPVGCGVVNYRLSPETKSSRTKRANVCVAYATLSGLNVGKWFHQARVASGVGPDWSNNHTNFFTHEDGTKWTSRYFRQVFLYPSLRAQQSAGDAYLKPYAGGATPWKRSFGCPTATAEAPGPTCREEGCVGGTASAKRPSPKFMNTLDGNSSRAPMPSMCATANGRFVTSSA
jgi:hypothetical protein